MASGVMGIVKHLGQLLGHVLFAGSGYAVVNLLQQHDISVVVVQNFSDALGLEASVQADGPVNIVGEDFEFQLAFDSRLLGGALPVLAPPVPIVLLFAAVERNCQNARPSILQFFP